MRTRAAVGSRAGTGAPTSGDGGGGGVIARYRAFLPVSARTPVVTLQEGGTPLVRAARLSDAAADGLTIYLKCEGQNPTGSFKDRGMTVAVSHALEEGARAVICASTGNTAASASAYAARAGLTCFVVIPQGAVAVGKLAQTVVHGAVVVPVEGAFDVCLDLVREICRTQAVALVNSVNPFRLEGQKTAAFEICDSLGGRAPAYQVMPVGNAGNITAYWKGYREYHAAGRSDGLPKLIGFQAAGAAPLVRGAVVAEPRTIATAIRIGNPASWKAAEQARDESGGLIDAVTDEEITAAYHLLAETEGIFVEPASAAAVAGLLKLRARRYFARGSTVVCILTGHGLKDPEMAVRGVGAPRPVPARVDAVLDVMAPRLAGSSPPASGTGPRP